MASPISRDVPASDLESALPRSTETDVAQSTDVSLEKKSSSGQLTVNDGVTIPQGDPSFKNLGRFQTTMIFITNEVGLGILSLPAALEVLGIVPGIIAIVGIGLLSTYTAYVLLQFYRRYPFVSNIADCGRVIGGPVLEWIVGFAFVVNLNLTCASAGLTMSIALNTITDNAICTVAFIAIPIIGCWLLCIPRTFKFVAQVGIPSTISIIAAVLIVMISLGISGPQQAGPLDGISIKVIGNPSFVQGFTSCLNIAFAYAGNQGFITVMAEMKHPSEDFVPALWWLQAFAITTYTVVAVVVYALAGQFVTSPALGAAPVLMAKIAYGIAFPCLLATGLVFGHTGIKYLHVLTMRSLGAAHEMTSNTRRSWIVWTGMGTMFWIMAFLLANVVPVFSSILNVSSAIFVSWFTFGISGVFWLHINRGSLFASRQKIALTIVNSVIIILAFFMNTGGMYASIQSLLNIFNNPNNGIDNPFTCANNGIF